jgi:hypothetical protein
LHGVFGMVADAETIPTSIKREEHYFELVGIL